MIIAIHQPQYLPWLGYFHKMLKADIFVILDDVQYKKNEWQNRNKIRTLKSWQWLTVPVQHNFGQNIDRVEIVKTSNWQRKHYHALVINYGKSPYFKKYEPFIRSTYDRPWEYLIDLNIHFIEFLFKALGGKAKIIKSSGLNVALHKTERLVEICKKLKADSYISGNGASEYIDLELFKKNGIKVIFQDFKHPHYKQVYSNFEPGMSVVDLLFNHGERSLEVLKGKS
jgi:hypothetical protein